MLKIKKIKDLIPDSIFCCIGYCDEKHLQYLENYILHNKFLLDLFNKIVVFYNGDSNSYYKSCEIWRKYYKYCNIHQLVINKGHTFGTMDLDNNCISWCKDEKEKYIFKSTSDIIFFPQFLEKEIPEADFYYLNGVGFATTHKYELNWNKLIEEHFFPQTNFYIIKNNIDYLNPKEEVDAIYELQQKYPNKRPWELKQGFESETMLKNCVERNNLTKYHLIPDDKFINLLYIISYNCVHDSSHKNIELTDPGICHLHYPENTVYSV